MSEVLESFLLRTIPDWQTVLWIGLPSTIFLIIWGFFVGWLKTKKRLKTGYTRKIFHFGIFTLACAVQFISGLKGVVLFGILTSIWVVYGVFRGYGYPFFEAVARETDAPRRKLFVIIPLVSTALGGILSNILFPGYAVVGYLVAGWGDAIAEPVGVRYGKHKYKVPSLGGVPATRSFEGSLSVFMVGYFAAYISLLFLGKPCDTGLIAALLVSFAVTITEAISIHGLDNLTVQVVASGIAYYFFA